MAGARRESRRDRGRRSKTHARIQSLPSPGVPHSYTRYNPGVPLDILMTAWRLPDAPLRSRALGVYAATFAALMLAAVAARAAWGLNSAYPWKAAAIFGVIAGLGFGFVQASHPFPR